MTEIPKMRSVDMIVSDDGVDRETAIKVLQHEIIRYRRIAAEVLGVDSEGFGAMNSSEIADGLARVA